MANEQPELVHGDEPAPQELRPSADGEAARPTVYDVGYASGIFDMFHVGHLNILRRARERCQILVVGVGSDEYAESIKRSRPVIPLDERLEIVAALGIVDEVMV